MNSRRMDIPAMIFGLIFLAIAGVWFARVTIGFGLPSFGWLAAAVLILLGVAGIASALRNARE